LFPDAELYDGSIGVAKEVKRQLELHNLNGTGKGEVIILDKID